MNKTPVFLLVEPSSIFRPVLSRWLEDTLTNARILIAANDQEALELVISEEPSYVLMALDVPDQKGFELLQQLRQTLQEAKIVITGWFESHGFVKKILSAGADGFIPKDELRSKLLKLWDISTE